jgi:copper(I)-binding protein
MLKRLMLMVALCTPVFAVSNVLAAGLSVVDAWSRAMPPVSRVGAAYLTINNDSAKPTELVGISSEMAERVEIHTHEMDGGMMRMRQLESLSVEAGGSVIFKPHGMHLMLFELKGALESGKKFELVLTFANGTVRKVEVGVR